MGKTIVFDLFPCEMGGGYFYDVTRTWCMGYAPEEVEDLHRQVLLAYADAEERIRAGMRANEIQPAVCGMFEAKGHPTIRSDPKTERGYVHLIGHGLGLNVHESPSFSIADTNRDVLQPGAVFTIEPGLYYPDRGMGVRLENTVWIRPDGAVEVIAPYPIEPRLAGEGRIARGGHPQTADRQPRAKRSVRPSAEERLRAGPGRRQDEPHQIRQTRDPRARHRDILR